MLRINHKNNNKLQETITNSRISVYLLPPSTRKERSDGIEPGNQEAQIFTYIRLVIGRGVVTRRSRAPPAAEISDDFHVLMELLTPVRVPACRHDYTLSAR